ncbi:hypothetical protein F5X97DRAFT_332514 [Nemania serpens]|nr:hypothetical protein F5X97DRAFT_332514 [Nemania serpens]
MVFCTYCGKGFTRKEHLERHITTHTNVKPYLCPDCGLGFSRRDLLNRHYNTYHEAREPMDRPSGEANALAGRNQIACSNCALAKTGCDKQTPSCTRCREKNLSCEARFARRSTKAANRAKARGSLPAHLPAPVSAATPTATPTTVVPALINAGPRVVHHNPQLKAPISPPDGAPMTTIDPRLPQIHDSPKHSSPANSLISFDGLPTPPAPPEGFRDLHYTNEAAQQDSIFGDNWPWSGNLEYDMYNGMSMQPEYHSMFSDFNTVPTLDLEKISSSMGSVHTRSTSIMSAKDLEALIGETKSANLSDGRIPEYDAVVAGDFAWPLARCNPVLFSGGCPRTAIVHLEVLEEKSRHEGTWNALAGYLGKTELNGLDLATVVPTAPRTRDNMLAIAQTFLHKALDIHRQGFHDRPKPYTNSGLLTFLVLPPSAIIDYFLQSYVRNLSLFYSLVSTNRLNPNEMINNNNQASTLLVLLMIAQGASVVPREEARSLSIGLIETCRISLFDIIEKNIEMCADSTVHRCSLLFTLLGAWSGDKWLMDIAMGQRGMYLEMLKHAGMFGAQAPTTLQVDDQIGTDAKWRSWLDGETKNRLVYNWVIVDQEISLFHDTAPLLAVSDLCASLPGPEQLWTSADPTQWSAVMQSMLNYSPISTPQPVPSTPSLYTLYQQFVCSDADSTQLTSLTPHRLRLLLHPLQTLLWHLQEMTFYSSDTSIMSAMAPTSANKPPAINHQEEAQSLLQKWQKLSHLYLEANPTCVATMANLVLFHLISLNSLTNFSAIERLARRDDFPWEPAPQRGQYIYRIEETIYHCGQVIRLVRTMPADRRPVWWSAAVYRAMLILWAHSLLPPDPTVSLGPDSQPPVVIDHVTLGSPDLYAYMWENTGIPVLSGPNGSTMSIDKPLDILNYAINLIQEGLSTRFSDGLIRKLIALNQHWSTWY